MRCTKASHTLLDKLEPLNARVNKALEVLAPPIHEAFDACVEDQRSQQTLEVVTKWTSSFTGISPVLNRRTNTHADNRCDKDGVDITYNCGSFKGGKMRLIELNLDVWDGPGAGILVRGRRLFHKIRKWEGETRATVVYFTHASVLTWFDHPITKPVKITAD